VSAAIAPAVSIVITTYNAATYIGACVRAALAQSCPDIEVLVLDDGSTDDTGEICRGFSDPRLRCLPRIHIGRCRALNEAVSAARGTYIAINDADDLSLPHRIEYCLGFLRAHTCAAYVGTSFLATEVFHDHIPDHVLASAACADAAETFWPSRAALFRRNLFNNSTLMYPKSTWERVGGYDEGLSNSEDYDFYLRAMQCGPAALLPGRTVLWYTNPHGFFKQKSRHEHLRTVSFIKRRAHRLLELPVWMKLYHPAWRIGLELTRRYPGLIDVVAGMRRRLRRLQTAPPPARPL